MSVGSVDTSGVTEINGVPVVSQGENSAMDQEMFLKLLTTQLANQDPMNPMDSNEMVAQQTQLAELEQIMNLSGSLESFVDDQSTLMSSLTAVVSNTQTIGLLNKDVSYLSDTIQVQDGNVSGLYYNLEDDSNVGFTIKNANGTAVRTISPALVEAGENIPVDFDASDLADGAYTVEFNVTDLSGTALSGAGFGTARVSSVDFSGGTPTLKLANGVQIGTGDVVSVQEGGE